MLLQASGELGPKPRTTVSENRLDAFGRAALRAVIALDPKVSRADEAGPFANETSGIVTVRRLLPDWAIRLLVGTLLLPPLLTAFDAFFGARRRHLPVARWLGWVGAAAVPFLLTWLWIRMLGLVGAVDAPLGPVLPDALPLRGLEHRRARVRPARARADLDRGARRDRRAARGCPRACRPAARRRRSGS